MYTVKHVAALTRRSPDTLRVWERRYGVVSPARSEGGYRLYDEEAVQRLQAMSALVAAGCSPRVAAARVMAGTTLGPHAAAPGGTAPAGHPRPGVLATAAEELDTAALDEAVRKAFDSAPYEQVVDAWLMPELAALGRAWTEGRVSVGGEHFVSAVLLRRIFAVFDEAYPRAGAPVVMVGLPRGARHELGSFAFAAALRRAGLDVVWLGADVPSESWVVSVTARRPAAVVLGVPTSADVLAARETVAALAAACPDVPVFVGGGQQDLLGAPARALGHEVAGAAAALAGLLAVPA